jgi:hypothetical protein
MPAKTVRLAGEDGVLLTQSGGVGAYERVPAERT